MVEKFNSQHSRRDDDVPVYLVGSNRETKFSSDVFVSSQLVNSPNISFEVERQFSFDDTLKSSINNSLVLLVTTFCCTYNIFQFTISSS